jgi:hypothetical protein
MNFIVDIIAGIFLAYLLIDKQENELVSTGRVWSIPK